MRKRPEWEPGDAADGFLSLGDDPFRLARAFPERVQPCAGSFFRPGIGTDCFAPLVLKLQFRNEGARNGGQSGSRGESGQL